MRQEEFLILHYDDFSKRADALYKELDSSASLRELVLNDPAGVLIAKMFEGYRKPSPGRTSQANRLLFSLLSNAQFIKWSNQFQERMQGQLEEAAKSEDPIEATKLFLAKLDKGKLYQEVAEAALQFSDVETMMGFLDLGAEPQWCPNPTINPYADSGEDGGNVSVVPTFFVFVVVALIVVVMAAVSPLARPLTLSRQDLFRVSTSMVDQMTARAKDLRQSGKLASPGNFQKPA